MQAAAFDKSKVSWTCKHLQVGGWFYPGKWKGETKENVYGTKTDITIYHYYQLINLSFWNKKTFFILLFFSSNPPNHLFSFTF